jgi:phage baseplate assembly protein W
MAVYSDLNSINPTDFPLLTEEEAVYQSLFNIFNTTPGEALFVPEFGLDLEEELFELLDDISALQIFRKISASIERWETRVIIDSVNTIITPIPDENIFDLFLVFSIQGTDGQRFEFKGSFTK